MYHYSEFCYNDEQRAQFSLFFVKHREQFNKDFTLAEALYHLLAYMEQSSIILTFNTEQQLIAAANYWLYKDEPLVAEPSGNQVYISSALIVPEERSTKVFMHGFRDLMNGLHEQYPHLHSVVFSAQKNNTYLNKLYAKFASLEGEIEGGNGIENKYVAPFQELRLFLNRLKTR